MQDNYQRIKKIWQVCFLLIVTKSIKKQYLVACTGISFFIAAGLGKIIIEEETVFLLSHHAPVAKMLYNKKTGDKILFNGKEVKIEDLY